MPAIKPALMASIVGEPLEKNTEIYLLESLDHEEPGGSSQTGNARVLAGKSRFQDCQSAAAVMAIRTRRASDDASIFSMTRAL